MYFQCFIFDISLWNLRELKKTRKRNGVLGETIKNVGLTWVKFLTYYNIFGLMGLVFEEQEKTLLQRPVFDQLFVFLFNLLLINVF